MLRIAALFALASVVTPLAAQMGSRGGRCCAQANASQSAAPIASNPVVNITGVIGEVRITPGQGMPYLEVKSGGLSTRVYLGAMHYLIAENFSPKTGQDVEVKGYQTTDSVTAIQVTLTQEKKTLKLRDDKGWPLWRGGPWRGGRGRAAGCPRCPAN